MKTMENNNTTTQKYTTMPINTKLYQFLASLENDDAKTVWEFLDGNPEAIQDMIAAIADNHPDLDMYSDLDM
jgi:hypothetical protein